MTRLELLNAFRVLNQQPPLAKPSKSQLDEELEAYVDRYSFGDPLNLYDAVELYIVPAASLEDFLKTINESDVPRDAKTLTDALERLDKLSKHLEPRWVLNKDYLLRDSAGSGYGHVFRPPAELIPAAQTTFENRVRMLLNPRRRHIYKDYVKEDRWRELVAWEVRKLNWSEFGLMLECLEQDDYLRKPTLENVKAAIKAAR